MNTNTLIHKPTSVESAPWLDRYLPNQPLGFQAPLQPFIDIALIRGMIFRQRWLVAAIVCAALVGGLVFTLLSTPMYEAKATVRVEPFSSSILQGQDIDAGIAANQVYDYLTTQVSIIKSRRLAISVAQSLNLGERYAVLGADIDKRRPSGLSDEQWVKEKTEKAALVISEAVSAEFPRDSWVISILYEGSDPVLAAEIANSFAETFAASDTQVSASNNQYAQEVLQKKIKSLRNQVQVAEQSVNTYARDNGIIVQQSGIDDVAGVGGGTLTGTNLASINSRAASARADRITAEQRWRSIQDLPAAQLPEVQQSSVLQRLMTQRTAKQSELIDLRQRYDEKFPQIAKLNAQIEQIERQIEASSANIKATIRNDYIVALNQEKALENELAKVTEQTMTEQDKQVQFGVLEREAEALRSQLGSLLDRFSEISSAANVDRGSITMLDPALVPDTPYSPSLLRNMAFSLAFGVAFAVGLAILRESFDDRIRALDEVENRVGLPLLGHTPFVDERDIEHGGSNRFTALMEAYASIRASIEFALPRGANVIQLTSSQPGEGKSTTAVILAELFASMGRKTLLIDGDLRRPSVAQLLDLEQSKAGLIEVLLGHSQLQDAIIGGVHDNLDILPVGEVPTNPTEVLASSQLKEFIANQRDEYSLIIFDSSPIMGLADAPVLASAVDRTIFVLEANKVQFGQSRAALQRMRYGGAQLIGVILTKYKALEAGQSYKYQYNSYEYGRV